MKKIFITALAILFTTQFSYAMSFEDAMKSSKPAVIYIQMETCGYCKKFNPLYESMRSKYYQKFNFVKTDCQTGMMPEVCQKWNVKGVPFMALINPKTQASGRVLADCMWDESCLDKTLKSFQ